MFLESRDGLGLAVLGDLEVLLAQIWDCFAFVICYHDIQKNDTSFDLDRGC